MFTIDAIRLRLRGTGLADGEITLAGLERVARSLQLLARRIGRQLVGQEGVGRSRTAVERATELRLRGLAEGSAVLTIAAGKDDALMEGLEHLAVARIAEIFTGIAQNSPPAWTTPLIGEASVALIDALAATTSCELVSAADRWPAVWLSAREASRAVWPGATVPPERRPDVAVSGTLDLVDLRTSRFRIRDQLGHHITLDEVRNAAAAGRLIGAVVTAVGESTTAGSRGQIVRITGAVVQPTVPPAWSTTSLADAVAGTASPPAGGIEGVDDEEIDEFLTLIRQ